MQADGLSLDDKRQIIAENDIPDIISRYHNLTAEETRARTEKSFLVPVTEIIANKYDLSINRYKQVIYEQKEYALPADIIVQIEALDKERSQLMQELKAML
jgi:type I restriction enzyme M protein